RLKTGHAARRVRTRTGAATQEVTHIEASLGENCDHSCVAWGSGPPSTRSGPAGSAADGPAGRARPLFERFKSPQWHERANAFRSLLVLGGDHDMAFVPRPLHLTLARFGREANQIHVALIALLARENAVVAYPRTRPGFGARTT